MQITSVPAASLDTETIQAWIRILERRRDLDSPLFRPEWVRTVAGVRPEIEVAICREGRELLGCLPFRRVDMKYGESIAGQFTSLQGAVTRPEVKLEPTQVLRACGLQRLRYAYVPTSQPDFSATSWGNDDIPCFDLSSGWTAYQRDPRLGSRRELQNAQRKLRKLQRDVGPVRCEFDCPAPEVLEQIVHWKLQQMPRTGCQELREPWSQSLIRHCMETRSANFGATVTALFLQDHLLAGAVSLSSGAVLQGWIQSHDPAYSRYSPGSLLLIQLAEFAAQNGVRRIDMGLSRDPYKRRFANAHIEVCEGMWAETGWSSAWQRPWGMTKRWGRRQSWGRHLQSWMRAWRAPSNGRSLHPSPSSNEGHG